MKKIIAIVAALMVVTGCSSSTCNNCTKKVLPCCERPVAERPVQVVRPITVANPCPQTVVEAPVVEDVVVPMTRVTTTYRVIEYKKPACLEPDCTNVTVNRPVRYRSAPRYVSQPVSEPVKLVAPSSTTYYTEDDYIK